ncbi:unnamed protein product [Symbiodinium sp. CCMP2456]|nr:unnamed protein product [Symbiodinium sp. CCMP2456]
MSRPLRLILPTLLAVAVYLGVARPFVCFVAPHAGSSRGIRGSDPAVSRAAVQLDVPMKESDLIQPDEEPERASYMYGFVPFAEQLNGRAWALGQIFPAIGKSVHVSVGISSNAKLHAQAQYEKNIGKGNSGKKKEELRPQVGSAIIQIIASAQKGETSRKWSSKKASSAFIDAPGRKKMEEDWNVVQLLAHHRRKFKADSEAQLSVVSGRDMQTFTRQFCQLCLTTLTSRGQDVLSASLRRVQLELKAARQDFEMKLARCNLGAMKQLDRVKGGTGTPLEDDHVTFFEPMRHLSEDQRLLVLMIVKDKLLRILDGSASSSFVEELKQSMGLDPAKLMDKASPKASDELLEDGDDVDLETALRRSKAAANAALRQAEEDRNHARSLQQELDRSRREVFSLKGQLAERQKQLEQLEAGMDKLKDLGLEPEEANFVLSELGLERGVSGASASAPQGIEVRYDGVPEDCTNDCILKWHSESGLEAESLVAVQIEDASESSEGGRRQPSILCTYERHADAEKAVVALQDSVLVSASGKKSIVTASMSPPPDASGSPTAAVGRGHFKPPKPLTSPTGSAKLEIAEAPTPTAASLKSLGPKPLARLPESPHSESGASVLSKRFSPKAASSGPPAGQDVAELTKTRKKLELLDAENKRLKVCLEEIRATIINIQYTAM